MGVRVSMLVFWRHGYEGASTANLTNAMGISTTSMYAAFGNKEKLFRKVLELKPEHEEAATELAALGPEPEVEDSGGFLKKLFGRR